MLMVFISLIFITIPVFGGVSVDKCFQLRDPGDTGCGKEGGSRFFFDKHTKRCQPFYFKGCGGNENAFKSREECMKTCSDAKEEGATHDDAVCKSGAFAAGATSGKLDSCSSCPKGYKCEDDYCCPTKEFLCKLQYDAGKFGSTGRHTPRYFYSTNFKNCMLFTFYGRDGNANNFATYNECKKMCM